MDEKNLRKTATASGSAAIVIGILLFFFADDSTADMPLETRIIASVVGIVACVVALRLMVAKMKF